MSGTAPHAMGPAPKDIVARLNAEMVKVVKPYTPAEIEAVSDYMSQMAPPKP